MQSVAAGSPARLCLRSSALLRAELVPSTTAPATHGGAHPTFPVANPSHWNTQELRSSASSTGSCQRSQCLLHTPGNKGHRSTLRRTGSHVWFYHTPAGTSGPSYFPPHLKTISITGLPWGILGLSHDPGLQLEVQEPSVIPAAQTQAASRQTEHAVKQQLL